MVKMKQVTGWVVLALALVVMSVSAYAHENHTKHNMVLVGENEIFASHIVYKSPHNYQVILKINLSAETRSKYLSARKSAPGNLMILLLDSMDISKIASTTALSGTLLSEDQNGNRSELETNIKIEQKDFQLLYFDEVPLSLVP
jgi:hypothetical protein